MGAKILLKKKLDLRGATLITGFKGIGYVGYIAVRHLVSALRCELIGFIDTKYPPPYVRMSQGRIVTPHEIYLFYNDESRPHVIVFNESALDAHDIYDLTSALAEWTLKNKFEKALLIGGLDLRIRRDESESLRCVATRAYIKKYGCDLRPLDEGYYVFGPLALLLAKYEIHDFPALAILPYASIERADPKAAALALNYLSKLCGFKVEIEALLKEAERLEEELKEIEEKRRREMEHAMRGFYV